MCSVHTANDLDFVVGSDLLSWEDAVAWCLNNHGRYLASIQSNFQNAAVLEVCGYNNCWIGARCYDSDCIDWEWQDGRNWSYTNWNTASGEPNNVDEKCVEMYGSGYWNDNLCSKHSALPLCGNRGIMTLGHIYMLFIKNDHCSK